MASHLLTEVKPLRVAIVTPWYGPEAGGGAERQARQIALGLRDRGVEVELLTTCARSFIASWSVNHYAPGAYVDDAIRVRRFRVDPRDAEAFNRANATLVHLATNSLTPGVPPVDAELERSFIDNGINSSDLIAYLRASGSAFDSVLFLPYPYGVIVHGVAAVAERAVLQPCLHDESYAYLPSIEGSMHAARRLLFNSEGELELALRLYGPGIAAKSRAIGQWIDDETVVPKRRIKGIEPARERYVLYLGLRDRAKQLDLLIESFARFRRDEPMSGLRLFLAGPGRVSYGDPARGIFDFGHVSAAAKEALLSNALALFQPSINESYSRVMMEAWSKGKPVAVNARCAATARPTTSCDGGWLATTKAEWSDLFRTVDGEPLEALRARGRRGYRYFSANATRESVVERYVDIFEGLRRPGESRPWQLTVSARSADTWEDESRPSFMTPSDPSLWDITPHAGVAQRLSDGKLNVLYVGRFDEYACLEQLLAGFAFLLSLGVDARLVLAGRFTGSGSLSERVFELIASSGLDSRVLLFEGVPTEVLAACYRNAHVFWSMAETWWTRWGVLDAMSFGVPVLAYASPVAKEVLGSSGLLFTDKSSSLENAVLARLVATDTELRAKLSAGERKRVETFAQLRSIES